MKTENILIIAGALAAGYLVGKKKEDSAVGKTKNYWDPNIKSYINKVARKLLVEGLTPSTYTKEKAKYLLKDIVAPVWGRKMVDGYSPEIKEEMKRMRNEDKIRKRLEYLRKELQAERISYGELAELQSLAKYIDRGDVELLQAAGVPEDEISGMTCNATYAL